MRKEVKKKICGWSKCKKLFNPWTSTQKTCPNSACAYGYILENPKKAREEMIENEYKILKEQVTDYHKKLQDKMQEIARLIDHGQPCLARGTSGQMHGGHIYAKGGNLTIALNLHNIHRQGAQSNHFQNDDGVLREGVIREYGQEYMDFISELRSCKSLEYFQHEYKEFYKRACSIANTLKKNLCIRNKTERIEMRNSINQTLGIYKPKYCIYNA